MNGIQATLSEDGGAAAASGEFFRCPQFLAAEEVTHTLHLDAPSASLAIPLIVREIPGSELRDAISPYGYPGATGLNHAPVDPGAVDWSATGLVSIFVRDRIDAPPCFSGGTARNPVQIADPALPSGIRKRLREQIRRATRQGWETSAVAGPGSTAGQRTGFCRAYDETMERTAAAGRYRFALTYFDAVLSAPASWLVLATCAVPGNGDEAGHGAGNGDDARRGERAGNADGDHTPAAGAIVVRSDGFLHYFLGGTADAALSASPMKSVFAAMIELAGELQVPLHLGGGVTPGDSLDRFKRGFANRSARMITHEIVCDQDAYRDLASAAPGESGFFPAYRG